MCGAHDVALRVTPRLRYYQAGLPHHGGRMKFPTDHDDLRRAWLYLRDHGQTDHANTIFEFAKMFKRNFEDMQRFANLADNLQRNQSNYETIRQQAIKNCGRSRKADNS